MSKPKVVEFSIESFKEDPVIAQMFLTHTEENSFNIVDPNWVEFHNDEIVKYASDILYEVHCDLGNAECIRQQGRIQ